MKHISNYLLVAIFLTIAKPLSAQDLTSTTYPITVASEPIFSMALSDTVIPSNRDSVITSMIPIGFNFHFCGQIFDSFSIATDGYIRLGRNANLDTTNNLNSGTNNPILAAYWDDMATGTNGHVATLVTGISPNRKRIIQWRVTAPKNLSGLSNAVFQLVMYEGTGKFKFIYTGIPANANNFAIGIAQFMNGRQQLIDTRASTSTFYYNPSSLQTNTGGVTAKSYTFWPDSTKPAKPTNFKSYVGPDCAVLSWKDSSITEDCFNIYRSTDSINFALVANVSTATKANIGKRYLFHDNNLQQGQKYYYKVTANTMGGEPSDTLFGSFVTQYAPLSGIKYIPEDFYTITEALEFVKCGGLNGPLALELHSNYDTIAETFPIKFNGPFPTNAVNTVTIRPASGVTQPIMIGSNPPTKEAINFNKASYFCLDGQPGGNGGNNLLYVEALSSQTGSTVLNESGYNKFSHIRFINGNSTIVKSLVNIITPQSAQVACNQNTFVGCEFDGRSIIMENLLLLQSNSALRNDSNSIQDCSFKDFRHVGLLIGNGNTNTKISGNSFFFSGSYIGDVCLGIQDTVASNSNTLVTQNYFGGTSPYASGILSNSISTSFYAIQVGLRFPQQCEIQGNVCKNINLTNTAARLYMIYMTGGKQNVGTSIANLIGDTIVSASVSAPYIYGISSMYSSVAKTVNAEIAQNIISGIKTNYFFGIHLGATSVDTARVTANIHDNIIGHPGMLRSIRSNNSNTYLHGINAVLYKSLGKISIQRNLITNFWGCDSAAAYGGGSSINGIKVLGYLGNGGDLSCIDTIFITDNTISNLTSSYNAVQHYTDENEGMDGIWCRSRVDDISIIKGNIIKSLYSINPNHTHYLKGIQAEGNANIIGNKILALVNKSVVQSYIGGIVNVGSANYVNNMISLGCDSSGLVVPLTAVISGILSSNDTFALNNYFNNSIYLSGEAVGSSETYCIQSYPNGANQFFNCANNIFYNHCNLVNSSSSSPKNVIYNFTANVKPFHNVYYFDNPGSGLAINNASILSGDTTSILGQDPRFLNPCAASNFLSLDLLHNSPAINFCPPNPLVSTDIENRPRSVDNIDAGCYEHTEVDLPPDTVRPTITILGSTSFCSGSSVTLSVVNHDSTTYQWRLDGNSIGLDTNVLVASITGLYTVTAINSLGAWPSIDSVFVNVKSIPNHPTILYGSPLSFCQGDSVVLGYNPLPNLTYTWTVNNNSIFNDDTLLNVTESGIYSLNAANECGVTTASNPLIIGVLPSPPQPIINIIGSTTFCTGDSAILYASPGFASYHWNDGALTSQKVVYHTGAFSLFVTDSNGCSSIVSQQVAVNESGSAPLPQIISPQGPLLLCAGDSATISVPEVFGTLYNWFRNGVQLTTTDNYITCNTSGVYSVTANNTCGTSTATNQVEITVTQTPSAPIITYSTPLNFCVNDSVILSASGGLVTYQWSTGQSVQNINVYIADTIFAWGFDVNGCRSNNSAAVITATTVLPNQPLVAVNNGGSSCTIDSARLFIGNLEANLAYEWFRDSFNLGVSSGDIWVKESGNYWVHAQNLCGTRKSDSLNVIISSPTISHISNKLCSGDGMLFNQNFLTVAGTYYDTLATVNGCDSIIVLTLTVNDPISTAYSYEMCLGDSVIFDGEQLFTTGIYRDTLSSVDGCDSIVVLNLVVKNKGLSTMHKKLCQGESFIFNGINYDTTGVYTNILTGTNGCDSICTLILDVMPLPTPILTAANGYLYSGKYVDYQWLYNNQPIPGANSDSVNIDLPGSYSVVVTDSNGCTNSSAAYLINTANSLSGFTDRFSIYPNPAAAFFKIDLGFKPQNSFYEIAITNGLGQQIDVTALLEPITIIDIDKLEKGFYIIELRYLGSGFKRLVLIHQ